MPAKKLPAKPRPRTAKLLTPKQTLFVELYLVSLNATQAYREAYGCSLAVADANGPRLLGNARIKAIVDAEIARRAKAAGMDADEVIARLAHIGRVDIGDLYDDSGCLRPVPDMPKHVRLAIASIEVDEIFEWVGEGESRKKELVGYTKKVKFWDKPGSLVNIGRSHKLFTDRKELDATESLAALVLGARARRAAVKVSP